MLIIIKNKGYATLHISVVAFDFKTLLNRGIPPINTKFRVCKASAIKTSMTSTFSDNKLVSLTSLTLILNFTIANPMIKTKQANSTVNITSKSRGSSNR